MRRRTLLGGAAAGVAGLALGLGARPARAADATLTAQPVRHALTGPVTEGLMSYAESGPPPVLWLDQGRRFEADLVNRLGEETTVHWHGLRVPIEQDGVPYVSQAPVAPGAAHRYGFVPQDAGTFWYHPHCNTLDQMGRGLTGVLVVREPRDPGFDADLPVNLRDFRLGGDGQLVELFRPRGAARGGTLGTVLTADWRVEPVRDLPAGGLVRLRLAATDATRVYRIALEGLSEGAHARAIALDGHPVPGGSLALDPAAPLLLGPGQRADLALRMPGAEGREVAVVTGVPGGEAVLLRLRAVGASLGRSLAELAPLPPNPVGEPDLASAETVPFVFGWSPEGDAPAASLCGSLGFTFWSINRAAWPGDFPLPPPPLATLRLGRSYVLRFQNETPNDHPIHLHGMAFRLLRSNLRPLAPLWTDTALVGARETLEVALLADNPGDWMLHCHVIEHQKTGLSGVLRVA